MDNTTLQLLTAVFISAAASLLGVFAILKRMSLVGDALSHVALPGIALAIFFKINPFIGVLLFLLVATVGIWLLEYKSSLSVDTLVGVFLQLLWQLVPFSFRNLNYWKHCSAIYQKLLFLTWFCRLPCPYF